MSVSSITVDSILLKTSPVSQICDKSKLANTIIAMMPEHKAYCEVFAGAAWVFFKKPISKYEVINDLNSDIVSFYRILQNHLEEFSRQFKWLLSSRDWFEDWKRQQAAGGLTDIQRVARYYYLQRLCFGVRVRVRVFGTAPMHNPRINLLRLEEEPSAVYLRLVGVSIEHLPWEEFIKRYNKPGTLFYCDPPCYNALFYDHNLELADYQRMASILTGIKSQFILSINDHPDIREIFKKFIITPVTLKYTISKGKQTTGRELLLTNF